jgi:hypothetical protein
LRLSQSLFILCAGLCALLSLQGASTDKLTANVSFPLKGLRLHQFASPECPAGPDECSYDLFAVSNHYGNLSGELGLSVFTWMVCGWGGFGGLGCGLPAHTSAKMPRVA